MSCVSTCSPPPLKLRRTEECTHAAETAFDVGPIPDSYQHLQNLVDLSLKHSNRNGTIPLWLEAMDDLILLDLGNNKLTGEISWELTDMLSLRFLC